MYEVNFSIGNGSIQVIFYSRNLGCLFEKKNLRRKVNEFKTI